ncbi:hypothetical protein KIN20_016759 [Parelaphostrongylus tenuis]|uniref:Uncharacterized protein n=1 Tax=Parelaphostrongylus tenuis TaxID=148309 RepID=A0AAD5QN53_PARTN|nr:hypothetical protein KIN20_016759 [Parelaphostrongylus tenuis]
MASHNTVPLKQLLFKLAEEMRKLHASGLASHLVYLKPPHPDLMEAKLKDMYDAGDRLKKYGEEIVKLLLPLYSSLVLYCKSKKTKYRKLPILQDALKALLETLMLTERVHVNCRHLNNVRTISRCSQMIHKLSWHLHFQRSGELDFEDMPTPDEEEDGDC